MTTEFVPSTTCIAVSSPASTYVLTYSSGEPYGFFSDRTTFTELTTVTRVAEPRIVAECLTLTPGQTSLPTVENVGVRCSTSFRTLETLYHTFSVGYTNPFDLFDRPPLTAPSTVTTVLEPTQVVSCEWVPDYQNEQTCDTVAPLTWASLVSTFIAIQLTWWIFDLPILWKKDEERKITLFLDAVSWACVRSHSPGSAATIVLFKGEDLSEYPRIWYMGMQGRIVPPEWTHWKLWTSVLSDLISITAAIITLYQACTLPQFDARRQLGLSLWVYPSLPVALIGICFLAGQRLFARSKHPTRWLVCSTLLVLVSIGAAIAVALWRFDSVNGSHMWYISIIFYGLMIFPMIYLPPLAMPAWCAGAWFIRAGGVSLAALHHYSGGQPYCHLKGAGFAAVYITLGAVAALLATVGSFYHGVMAFCAFWDGLEAQLDKFFSKLHLSTKGRF